MIWCGGMVTESTGCEVEVLLVGRGSELVITTFTGGALVTLVDVNGADMLDVVLVTAAAGGLAGSLTAGWVVVCDKT